MDLRLSKPSQFTAITLLLAAGALPAVGQMAVTSNGKFLGNILRSTTTPDPYFDTYWNQVTPENSGKWGSVEATRDVMNWTNLDYIHNFTRTRNIPLKHHTFVWGQQTPAWITSLTQAQQREEVEEWISAFATRYPNTEFIDVVNEPLHAPAEYRDALGGAGTTGWDWVIWAFEKARLHCPNAKLLLNDYNIINSDSATTDYLTIINLLKDRGLIDGIGEQAHFYESTPIATIQNNLNRLVATGLPIYISELDINLADDTAQLNRYQTLFPVFWTNPAVRGITLWGYKQGVIWQTDAYLLRSDGSERPALTWITNYVSANPQSFSASVTSPANGQGFGTVAPVSASATVAYGTAPFTVTFQKKLDHESGFTTVSSDNTAPYTADLGALPMGTYQIRVFVTDSASMTVTSPVNTFNIFQAASGTWLGTSGNWSDPGIWAGGTIANGANSTANFTGVNIGSDQTIPLNGNRAIGNIVFTDATTSSHDLTISGADTLTLDVTSNAPIINVTQADRKLTISSVVAGNDGLQKSGSGTLTLTGNNTFTGTTTISSGVLRLEGGAFSTTARNYSIASGAILSLAPDAGIATGVTAISGGGTLRINNGAGITSASEGRGLSINMGAGSTIDVQAGGSIFNGGWQAFTWTNNKATLNVDGSVNLWDGDAVSADALTGSGLIESTTGQQYGSPNLTLGVNNGSGTFSGNITAVGDRAINLNKNGTGTQIFSGSTTFKGSTTINGGTLQFAKTSSLYAGVTSSWVKSRITVNNGGTIAFNVGGMNEFTNGDVTTLLNGLGGALSSNGLRAGSTIAFDTTNASGGTFTLSDTIANTTGAGGGAVGLEKLGANTLILTQNNTYTGGTRIDSGALTLGASGSIDTSACVIKAGATLNTVAKTTYIIPAGKPVTFGIDPTGSGSCGKINAAGLNVSNATITYDIAGPLNDAVYVLATYTAGQLSGTFLSSPAAPAGYTLHYAYEGNKIALVQIGLNLAPGISNITDLSAPSGRNTGALAFVVTDEDVNSVTPTGTSSNPALVPVGNILFGGSGANRTVTITPVSGLSGSATITVTLTDNGSLNTQDIFTLTVTDNYLSWATAQGITGGENNDSDNDGVKNLVEYALLDGGEHGLLSSNTITFSKRGTPYGTDLTYTIETSDSLAPGSWTPAVTHGPELLATNPTISHTFTPSSPAKNFARLKVISQ